MRVEAAEGDGRIRTTAGTQGAFMSRCLRRVSCLLSPGLSLCRYTYVSQLLACVSQSGCRIVVTGVPYVVCVSASRVSRVRVWLWGVWGAPGVLFVCPEAEASNLLIIKSSASQFVVDILYVVQYSTLT